TRPPASQAYGSIWRTAATSAGFTSVSFLSLRMRPERLVPSKWRLPECMRRILPFAVTLKRLAAPRWVLSFFLGFDALRGIENFSILHDAKFFARPLLSRQDRPGRLQKTEQEIPRPTTLARWPFAVRAWPALHPFSAPATPPGHCLPCAAWFRSGKIRRFRPAAGSSWRDPLPGAPFRGHDERSSRALCGLRRGSG